MSNNTFKLKSGVSLVYIPNGKGVITKDSPDELVEVLFNSAPERKQIFIDRFFDKLPASMVKKSKKVEKPVEKVVETFKTWEPKAEAPKETPVKAVAKKEVKKTTKKK